MRKAAIWEKYKAQYFGLAYTGGTA
jgi:hypothetical protein